MFNCPKCGVEVEDGAAFCPNCGEKFEAKVETPSFDHTAEFDAQDISDNKVISMIVYLFGIVGIIIGLLAGVNSKYAAFHVRQALKVEVLSILVAIATCVLCWTIIVPFAGAIALAILFVVRIIAFFQICKGQAKELPIVRGFKFLK